MMNIREEFKGYEKVLSKTNISLYDLERLQEGWTITLVKNTYEKLGRKNFPKNPTQSEESEITARQLACLMTSTDFFKDKIVKGATQLGYKAVKLTCISPDRETKIERIFNYTFNN